MLRRFFKSEPSLLDEPIDKVLAEMEQYGPDSPEYKKLVKYLERLMKIKAEDRREKIKPDTILLVAGNLLGILVIVAYEHNHAMISKALAFIRPRT